MISLAVHSPVRGDVAMTGEVTLRGLVLPIGGIRDKALGALRAGITRVILPKANVQDLHDIPKDLKRRITFIPVETMADVLEAALEQPLSEIHVPAPRPTSQPVGTPGTFLKKRGRV